VDLCSSFSGTGEASVFDICLDLSGVELNEITITMKISPDQSLRVEGRAPLAAHSNGALPGQLWVRTAPTINAGIRASFRAYRCGPKLAPGHIA
jgi:hypothetical protein